MNAEEAAQLLKLWAAEKGFVSKDRFVGNADEAIALADFGLIDSITPQSIEILHSRGINYVAFNSVDNQVLVFTRGRLTKKEKGAIPALVDGTVTVSYKQGGHGSAGSPPGGPAGVPPFGLHNGRYTCGSSIHPANLLGAGTLGCLVRDQNEILYGLSNNHITGGCNFSAPAAPILAPGPVDATAGNHDPFTIGYHDRLLPMVDGLPQNVNVSANSDAAIFRIRDANLVTSMQRGAYDTPTAMAGPLPNMQVQKIGRATGLTIGRIRGQVAGAESITYSVLALGGATKVVYFTSLFIVEGVGCVFSEGGDSGSLVTTVDQAGNRSAVGIILGFNHQSKVTFILPISPILQSLGVTLVSGLNI